MPLTWSQVHARLDPTKWTLKTAPRRLRQRGDPLRPVLDEHIQLDALLASLGERLAGEQPARRGRRQGL
jgi:DNA primase